MTVRHYIKVWCWRGNITARVLMTVRCEEAGLALFGLAFALLLRCGFVNQHLFGDCAFGVGDYQCAYRIGCTSTGHLCVL